MLVTPGAQVVLACTNFNTLPAYNLPGQASVVKSAAPGAYTLYPLNMSSVSVAKCMRVACPRAGGQREGLMCSRVGSAR